MQMSSKLSESDMLAKHWCMRCRDQR